WMWHEWMLTYAPGQFKLYVRASKFPSHAWYLDGRQVATSVGIGDPSFPGVPVQQPRGSRARIDVSQLALFVHVLSKGPPAADPQTPNGEAERERRGPVTAHPNTVVGWPVKVVTLSQGNSGR